MVVDVAQPRFTDEEELQDFPLRLGLNWRAKKEAERLYRIARGVMLITGKPGSGKDLFGVGLSAMNKYYFSRRILLDFLPKRAFGDYTLFNGQVMSQEIDKMAKKSGVENIDQSADKKEFDDFIQQETVKWATEGEGEVLLKNGVLYLSELKRYCYNRNPHNRFNKFVGSICSVWRHLDLLIIGTHVFKHEIDRFTYLAYTNHWAKCSWSLTSPDTTDVTVRQGAFIGATDVYHIEGLPSIWHVDGNKPWNWLGGKRFYDLYNTKNMVNLRPVARK